MKEKSVTDKFVVVSSIILVLLIIGLFFIPAKIGTTMMIILLFLYVALIIGSLFLLIKSFLSRNKITRKWIKYFAFLPICVAIVPPLFMLVLQAFGFSILDKQCHELICELRSSESLKNVQREISTQYGDVYFYKSRQEGDSYIYDISILIVKERERKLIVKADNCTAVFLLDIPEVPKPQPFSKWEAPIKISTGKDKKIKLELRYKVVKNKDDD